nr:T9SS type A sorting domain-containing protein [Bacteroidia bacterium]
CLTVVKNGCSYTTCQNVNVTRTDVELVNDLADAIKVYPNPATNNIFIAAPVPVQQISLVNELGSRLWESNAPAQSLSISLSPFAAGVYFINVKTDAGIIRKKLIIIK